MKQFGTKKNWERNLMGRAIRYEGASKVFLRKEEEREGGGKFPETIGEKEKRTSEGKFHSLLNCKRARDIVATKGTQLRRRGSQNLTKKRDKFRKNRETDERL